MEGVCQWVEQLVSYLVFVTVLMGILPNGKYEKYIRLFAGCVLILLVFQPLTESFRLEEQISRLFDEFSMRNEAGELRGELGHMEKMRLERMLDGYEQAAAKEAARMAREEGFETVSASVELNRREDSPSFAGVERIRLQVGEITDGLPDREDAWQEDAWRDIEISVAPIFSEQVSEAAGSETPGSESEGPEQPDSEEKGTEERGPQEKGTQERGIQERENAEKNSRISELRSRIASYYRVEENHVEIRVETGSGVDSEK